MENVKQYGKIKLMKKTLKPMKRAVWFIVYEN